MLSFHVFDFLR